MSKSLELPDELFQLVQDDAIPFVDLTPASVIKRWADFYKTGHRKIEEKRPTVVGVVSNESRELKALNPPDLLHTIPRGTFGSTQFRKWNDLVRIAHIEAFRKARTFEQLRTVTPAQIRNGNHEGDSGYHFVPEIGISVQGVDANHAWSYALRLAQYCKVPIRIHVEWRNNERAAFPGEAGSLAWNPTSIITEVVQA